MLRYNRTLVFSIIVTVATVLLIGFLWPVVEFNSRLHVVSEVVHARASKRLDNLIAASLAGRPVDEGYFFRLPDSSWIAIISDSGSGEESAAVTLALDSSGKLYKVDDYLEVKFRTWRRSSEMAAEYGDDSDTLDISLPPDMREIYLLASSRDLNEARHHLEMLGMKEADRHVPIDPGQP